MRSLRIVVLVIVTLAPYFGEAQSFFAIRRNRNLLVGAGSGSANYYGELVNPGEFGTIKPNITVNAEYYFTPRISGRAQLTWFQYSGDDKKADDDRVERNLSFTSSNIEFSALGVVNLTPMGPRFYQRPVINLHAFLGIGVLRFNPKAEVSAEDVAQHPTLEVGKKYALATLQTEGVKYSRFQPVVPIGFGARIKVNPFVNVLIEGGYRITFTDYLDDVSERRYVDPATLKNEAARYFSDRRIGENIPANPQTTGVRGNPSKNDGYFIANVIVQYYLPTEILRNSQNKLYRAKRKFYNRRR